MSSANATNVHRKSGVAEWRDLRFLSVLTHSSKVKLSIEDRVIASGTRPIEARRAAR